MQRKQRKWPWRDRNFFETWIFPELEQLSRTRDRKRALELAKGIARSKHSTIALAEGLAVLVFTAMVVANVFLCYVSMRGYAPYVAMLILFAIGGASTLRMRRGIRIELRKTLKQDFWCHGCDYLLRENTTGRCPECGTEIPPEQARLIAAKGAVVPTHVLK